MATSSDLPVVLFTGSRDWPHYTAVVEAAKLLKSVLGPYVVMHGAARGLDTFAGIVAGVLRLPEDPNPASWNLYGKAAGPLRNTTMLRKRPVMVVAFWRGQSRGTLDCIEKAINTFRIPVVLYRD